MSYFKKTKTNGFQIFMKPILSAGGKYLYPEKVFYSCLVTYIERKWSF